MNEVVEEIRKVKVFYIASVDKEQPHVRPFGSILEFEGNAYICTGKFKNFYKQVKDNPRIELCGMYDDEEKPRWLRVAATLEEDNRIEVQKAMLLDPTGPKGLYEPGDGKFATFKLTNIKARICTFFEPDDFIE